MKIGWLLAAFRICHRLTWEQPDIFFVKFLQPFQGTRALTAKLQVDTVFCLPPGAWHLGSKVAQLFGQLLQAMLG